MEPHTALPCPFLDLPTEVRLLIYDFAVLDNPIITIGCAELVGSHPDIVQRLYSDNRTPYPGIPPNNEPIIESHYEPSLLSPVNPAVIPLTPTSSMEPDEVFEESCSAHESLLLVSRQVSAEVRSHFRKDRRRGSGGRGGGNDDSDYFRRTSLFMQYPYGLHIMRTSAPKLARQARSVHLAGTYRPHGFWQQQQQQQQPCFGPLVIQNPAQQRRLPDSASELAALIKSLFGGSGSGSGSGDGCGGAGPSPPALLEMRIYYPGEDAYSTVWADDASPIGIALHNIAAARVDVEVWRGRYGTGIYLAARPAADGQRGVSTVWRRLVEGRRNEPKCGSWVVDGAWPAWECEGKAEAELVNDSPLVSPV